MHCAADAQHALSCIELWQGAQHHAEATIRWHTSLTTHPSFRECVAARDSRLCFCPAEIPLEASLRVYQDGRACCLGASPAYCSYLSTLPEHSFADAVHWRGARLSGKLPMKRSSRRFHTFTRRAAVNKEERRFSAQSRHMQCCYDWLRHTSAVLTTTRHGYTSGAVLQADQ